MTNLLKLYDIADQEGIDVDCIGLVKRESLAIMDHGSCYIAIDPFKLTSSIDEKVKLSHELGHCLTGSFYNQYVPFDERRRNESRATRWALKKLLPFEEMRAAMDGGYTEPHELADYFEVTEDLIREAIAYYTGPCGLSFQKILPDGCQI